MASEFGHYFGSILARFEIHFGTLLGSFFGLIFEVRFWLLCFIDFDVHFGSMLASKTTPGRALTRKGRPSILNDSPMKIKLFDPVAVAGGSRGRPLKPNTFYKGIWASKCLENNPKIIPKVSKTVPKIMQKLLQQKYTKTH